jgi:type I restriction enzyme S subunit
LSEIVTLQYGKSPRDVISDEGQYPILGTGGLTGHATDYLYDGPTTVLGRKGTINKPCYVEGKFWAIDTTYYGTDYQEADPKWFYYVLSSKNLTKYNEASGVPSLSRETLNNIPLLSPPLPEQQKITTILSSVDEVIEKTRAQIDKLKDLKTGMTQELLTKGIGHTEFKDSPVGRIPVTWTVAEIKDIAGQVKPGPFGSSLTKSMYVQSGYKVYGQEQVISGDISVGDYFIDHRKYEELSAFQVAAGDILISLVGTFGQVVRVPKEFTPGIINPRLLKLRFPQEVCDPIFMVHQLRSEFVMTQLQAFQQGGTMGVLSATTVKPVRLVVPPLEEQSQIGLALDSINSSISTRKDKVASLESMKKALMQDLLTGKVRVNVDQKETAAA